jgi:hypothetical protein
LLIVCCSTAIANRFMPSSFSMLAARSSASHAGLLQPDGQIRRIYWLVAKRRVRSRDHPSCLTSREATLESVLLLASFTLILLGIVSTVQDAPDDPTEGTRINDR